MINRQTEFKVEHGIRYESKELVKPHSVARPCNTVVRVTSQSHGDTQISECHSSKTPEPIDIKIDVGDYFGDFTPHKFKTIDTLGASRRMGEILLSQGL